MSSPREGTYMDTHATRRLQIQNAAAHLWQVNFVQESKIALVVHSPLQRAQETSEGLLQCRDNNEDTMGFPLRCLFAALRSTP